MKMLGESLIKDSTKRAFGDAMISVRRALNGAGFRSERDLEVSVGKVLEDAFVRSERLEEALVRAQSEAALSGQQLSTVRSGLQGVINDNRGRISQWENVIKGRDRIEREDFLWKTWDWLSQSMTWLNGKV